jgi:hypothetical protein
MITSQLLLRLEVLPAQIATVARFESAPAALLGSHCDLLTNVPTSSNDV